MKTQGWCQRCNTIKTELLMEKYIEDWFYVIKNCSVENTYKMGWSKSIVECCLENPNLNLISFDRISEKMFKYYWNQTIFFDLQQSPNPNKPPKFITYVKDQIESTKNNLGINQSYMIGYLTN